MGTTPSRAVFLDKDGTVLENVPYNVDPDRMQLAAEAGAGLRLLYEAGFGLVVVSNQSGVARGLFPEESLRAVESRLSELFDAAGARMVAFYYCPHHPHGTVSRYSVECSCRKPAPGMLLRGAREHCIDLRRSWMVGNNPADAEAGVRAGCRAVTIAKQALSTNTLWAPDLTEAANVILSVTPRHTYC
jgi:D-glycero-D-manno-heptose 1,7-bisphosphate phosphatase